MIKNRFKVFGCIALFTMLSFLSQAQTSWNILDDYTISFSGSGADGSFRGLEGSIVFDPQNLEDSRFEVSIDPASISTGNKTKDKHARGKSWFNVKDYITIKFESNRIQTFEDRYVAEGLLTLKGISKETRITFKFVEETEGKATFEGDFTVNRQDFDIEGPLISFMVGDEFDVSLVVPVEQ